MITQNQFLCDVVISGAGPVGLFLACELALADCSVVILEKSEQQRSPLKQMPFGIRGLSAPSIEALDRRGLLDELEVHKRVRNPHTTTSAQRQSGHFAGIPFYENNVDTSQWTYRLPGSTPASLISEMQELETVLTRRAEGLGVVIKRGNPVSGVSQNADGVTVHAGGQVYKAKWLAGCDGSRSFVRKATGFDFAGTEPEFTGYSAQVDIADPEKLRPGRNVTSSGMYLQSQPGYLIMQDFDGGVFHQSEKPITREHVQEVIRRISNTDVTITALHIATTWTDRARQVTTYRKDKIFLAGDAAHIHAPLGGQGLNLGLGDAMNLGWKLAAVIRGSVPESLLDTYESERHPIGLQVLDWSRAQVALMRPNPEARALYSILRDLINTCDGATYIAGRIWGIFTHYDVGENHPLTGHSVPNFNFADGSTTNGLMRDGMGLMIDFLGDTDLEKLAAKYKINYHCGTAADTLGFHAMLIRPDGIVSWIADRKVNIDDLELAASRWFA